MTALRDAIDRLAGLFEFGHLEADAAPADFLHRVADEIESSRVEISALKQRINAMHGWVCTPENCRLDGVDCSRGAKP